MVEFAKAVTVDILTGEQTTITYSQHIEFGEGDAKITISMQDGLVEISAARLMHIVPRSSNVIRVYSAR